MPANLENSAVATALEKVSFHSNPKGNSKECSNYHTIALISHANKVMLKILQTSLQQYVNHEILDVQAGFRKGRGTRDQIANICWIIEKRESSRKTSTSALLEKATATHSSILAWQIPGTAEPGGLPSMGSCRVRHNWSDLAVAVCFIDYAKAFDCMEHKKL